MTCQPIEWSHLIMDFLPVGLLALSLYKERGKKGGKLIIFQGSVLLPGSVPDILGSEVRGPCKDRCISSPEGRCCCMREFIHSG